MNFTHDLHTHLRSRTQTLHQQAQQTPFVQAVFEHKITRDAYAHYLRALSIITGTLEHQISEIKSGPLQTMTATYVNKFPLIVRDLEALEHMKVPNHSAVVDKVLNVAGKITLLRDAEPVALIGYLYTLEGSMQGGMIIKKHIAETLDLKSDVGLSFLGIGGNESQKNWAKFTGNLNKLELDERSREAVTLAASECFQGILELYKTLWPLEETGQGGIHVTMVNPEGGNHAVPQDPLELSAALHGGFECLKANPYFEARYGERGKRFTMSDSAWLVTLCRLDQGIVNQQVLWLSGFLSRKGIPRYLMEEHLLFLHKALIQKMTRDKDSYKKLLSAAKILEAERSAIIPPTAFNSLSGEFEKMTSSLPPNARIEGIGKVIVAAVADEKNNITEAVPSLTCWLTDPAHFSQDWISAVDKTVSTARER